MCTFPADHDVVIYEAAAHPLARPRIEHMLLSDLGGAAATEISTLYVAPVGRAPVDEEMIARLSAPAHRSENPARAS
jgi:hypothetical protein